MEKVRPWCGQLSDRGRLKNRRERVRTRSMSAAVWDIVWTRLAERRLCVCLCWSDDVEQRGSELRVCSAAPVQHSRQLNPPVCISISPSLVVCFLLPSFVSSWPTRNRAKCFSGCVLLLMQIAGAHQLTDNHNWLSNHWLFSCCLYRYSVLSSKLPNAVTSTVLALVKNYQAHRIHAPFTSLQSSHNHSTFISAYPYHSSDSSQHSLFIFGHTRSSIHIIFSTNNRSFLSVCFPSSLKSTLGFSPSATH